MHLLCKLCANIFCTLHTREETECKLYFLFTARPLRSPAHGMARYCTAFSSLHKRPCVPGDGTAASRGQQLPDPGRGYGYRYRAGATAGQPAPARGAAGRGRRQPAQARGDDAIRVASPGRRRRCATAIVSTIAAASAGSRVMLLRTLPRVLSCSKEQAHAQNLNAMARFHCYHLTSLRYDELEIIARKSSLALSLPSFLPPSLSLSKPRPRASRDAQNPAR